MCVNILYTRICSVYIKVHIRMYLHALNDFNKVISSSECTTEYVYMQPPCEGEHRLAIGYRACARAAREQIFTRHPHRQLATARFRGFPIDEDPVFITQEHPKTTP